MRTIRELLDYLYNLEKRLEAEGYDLEALGHSDDVQELIDLLEKSTEDNGSDKVKAIALFLFETEGEPEEIIDCIENQIITDRNAYWQNMDETAQMTSVNLEVSVPEEG